jgi:protein-tyrosine-phosphatase
LVRLALAYGLTYLPYAVLVKAVSNGYIPGVGAHQGLVLLPAAAIGQLIVMPIFLRCSGWWRYGTRSRVAGRRVFLPRGQILVAGFFMAIIAGATTLNFTFPGVSILFMLLLMRAGTLAMSPIIDRLRGRHVPLHARGAVILSLTAVAIALGDVDSYALSLGAIASVTAYIAAYVGRFQIMSSVAKTAVKQVDLRYLVGEHAAAPVFLVGVLGAGALLGAARLQEGFTTFLVSPAALPALGIGVLYECLFIFGTLIYLDYRPYSLAVPVNRIASLLAGFIAAFVLAALVPAAVTGIPGTGQQLALVAVLGAIAMLAYPALRQLLRKGGAGQTPRSRLVLFVCGANTCRSPMAEALAREAIAAARAGRDVHVGSAGVSVKFAGAPMTPEAIVALGELGIEVQHKAQHLTAELCRSAHVIYCMTAAQREAVMRTAPDMASKTFRLDPDRDLPDPVGQPLGVFRAYVDDLRRLVRRRMAELTDFGPARTGALAVPG